MVRKRTPLDTLCQFLLWILMGLLVIVVAYPFLYVFNAAITPESYAFGKLLIFPIKPSLKSYHVLLTASEIGRPFFISVARSLIGGGGMLIVSGMAAYALSTPDLLGGKFFRTAFVLTMYLGAGLIPSYIFTVKYKLINSFWVYILPGLCSTYNIILIRTYIESVSRSLVEAVYVDGGSDLQAYWKVVFPVCKPVNAAIFLFGVLGQWNAMVDTKLYAPMKREIHTLQYTLYNIVNSNTDITKLKAGIIDKDFVGNPIKMAVTVITIVPIMFVYPSLQKHFASGIMIGSIKA